VSPFSSSFPPQPRVYSRNQLLLPSSASRGANISPFSARCAYFPSQRGLVYPAPSVYPEFRRVLRSQRSPCCAFSRLRVLNPFASYHIPATPAVSCDYALFCATARRHPSYFQWFPHSFDRHGVCVPLWQIASQPKPRTGARRNETSFTGRIHPAAVGKSTVRLRTSSKLM